MPLSNANSPIHFAAFLTFLIYFKQLNPLAIESKTTGVKNERRKRPAILKNCDGNNKSNNINSLHL